MFAAILPAICFAPPHPPLQKETTGARPDAALCTSRSLPRIDQKSAKRRTKRVGSCQRHQQSDRFSRAIG
jgi:hypothetical protein